MRRWFAAFLLVLGFAAGAQAQATLRIGDPVDLKISGVPSEDQSQVNSMYTVDADGAINLPYIGKVHAETKQWVGIRFDTLPAGKKVLDQIEVYDVKAA